MANKFTIECAEIAKSRVAQNQIGFPPERLTMLRNMLDGIIATILGDDHFQEWAKQITGMVDTIIKLEEEFKLDSN